MSSVTALELVNRVRLFRRQPTTTVLTTPEDTVTLNAINMAIEDVLSTKRWEFDLRHDGQMTLRSNLDLDQVGTEIGVSNSKLGIARLAGLTDEDVFGDYIVTVQIGSSTPYPNTSIRAVSSDPVTFGVNSTLFADFTFNDSLSVTDGELYYGEYIMPDTVREIVRVSHQETSIELKQADPVVRYNELFPDAYESTGPPEVIAVGGYDIPTYNSGGSVPTPGLRFAVWPIPDDNYIINYSYYYRHPELLGASAALVGVPTSVVNDIVLQATSTVMMTWDQNYAASHFTDLSRQQAAAKHLAYGGSKARRRTIGSFERGRGSAHVELGFPHKLIGQ
jgi:hypothetical protein